MGYAIWFGNDNHPKDFLQEMIPVSQWVRKFRRTTNNSSFRLRSTRRKPELMEIGVLISALWYLVTKAVMWRFGLIQRGKSSHTFQFLENISGAHSRWRWWQVALMTSRLFPFPKYASLGIGNFNPRVLRPISFAIYIAWEYRLHLYLLL